MDSIMLDLEKPLTEAQIRSICYQMVQSLVFLHKMHVIHRDLKAGNVLLTMDGCVKLGEYLGSVLTIIKNTQNSQKNIQLWFFQTWPISFLGNRVFPIVN